MSEQTQFVACLYAKRVHVLNFKLTYMNNNKQGNNITEVIEVHNQISKTVFKQIKQKDLKCHTSYWVHAFWSTCTFCAFRCTCTVLCILVILNHGLMHCIFFLLYKCSVKKVLSFSILQLFFLDVKQSNHCMSHPIAYEHRS